MSVGDVMREAWDLYRRFLGRFFVTAAVVFAVLGLLSALALQAVDEGSLDALLWIALAGVIGVVGSFWVQAALVETVRDVRDGRADRSVAETYRAVQPRLRAVILAGILAGIGIAVGFVLFVVPGLFLLTIWAMIVPVIVLEGRPALASFGRSREIVRGNGWPVFGVVLLTVLVSAVASGIIRGVLAPLPDLAAAWLGSVIADGLTAPFTAAVLTTAYFRLTGGRAVEPEPVEARL